MCVSSVRREAGTHCCACDAEKQRALVDSSSCSTARACSKASRIVGRAVVGVYSYPTEKGFGSERNIQPQKQQNGHVFIRTYFLQYKKQHQQISDSRGRQENGGRETPDSGTGTACCTNAADIGRAPTPTQSRRQNPNPAQVGALTELVPSFVDEPSPLSGLLLPLRRQLDVVPACKPVLQVPLGLTVPAPTHTHGKQTTYRRGRVSLEVVAFAWCCACARLGTLVKTMKQLGKWNFDGCSVYGAPWHTYRKARQTD